ncbi:MAG: amino acid ABC transporter substrate-binding protein, partial [Desulfobacterales bacterium]|nr:amino acid ABC transporter substrate-binding protein [Desulfobacterales bacterium]
RHVRNGAVLAVERANRAGGVAGRPVELIIKDDKGDPGEALRVDQELIEEGAVAILGHYLSTLAVEVVPLMNEKNVLMINATGGTDELTGIDDNFIRLTPPVDQQALSLANLSRRRLRLETMAVVYDLSNPKYTESLHHLYVGNSGRENSNRGKSGVDGIKR